jgi:hypothetical protein
LTVQNGEKAVDNVDVETTWQSLATRPRSQLIDVRSAPYVGIPDLGSIGKRAILVEWQTFPDQTVDPRFVLTTTSSSLCKVRHWGNSWRGVQTQSHPSCLRPLPKV